MSEEAVGYLEEIQRLESRVSLLTICLKAVEEAWQREQEISAMLASSDGKYIGKSIPRSLFPDLMIRIAAAMERK